MATGELEIFLEIWNERPHYSEILGPNGEKLDLLPQGHKLWHWQFAHILNKNRYRKARLVKENIVLLTPAQHILFDNHIHKVKDKPEWKWLMDKREELKQRYYAGEF